MHVTIFLFITAVLGYHTQKEVLTFLTEIMLMLLT